MKHELFVEQPNIDLKKGIVVREGMELHFKNERVEQVLKDMHLETITNNEGTHNGINAFKTQSYIYLGLNEGDILLFDKEIGYYMPAHPMTTVDEAISDLEGIKDIRLNEDEEVANDTEGNQEEGSAAH